MDGQRTAKTAPLKPRSFLYSDLLSALRTRIADGTYPPGSRLPSLAGLTKSFRVSAITVRRAIRELVYEGLVEGRQGLGVFVRTKPRIHRVLAGDPDRSIGDEIRRAGFVQRLVEVDHGPTHATAAVAAKLGLRSGNMVFRHQKLTYASDIPVALHRLYMRPALARRLRTGLGGEFIFALLKKKRIRVSSLRCEFSASALTEEEARLLQMSAGFPIFRVDYTGVDRRGVAFILGETICRPDRFVFEVTLPRRKR